MFGLEHLALGKTFNRQLTLTCLLIAVSQFNFGFDQQGFSSTQAMNSFARQFGAWDEKKKVWYLPTVWTSLFNSLQYIGFGFGIAFGSWVSKHYGRRMCMFTMSLWTLGCTTIVITSKNSDQILAGRVLNYIYIGMELAVVPIYQSEIAPQQARGFIIGTYQLSLTFGGLVINSVARGTGSMNSNAAWQIPFGLFYVIPTFVASLIWFVPESPRWLVLKGDHDAALQALTRLRQGKFTEDEIADELAHIETGINQEVEKGTFFDMFRGKVNLKRSLIVLGANFFLQSTGATFASVYGALFVKSLGTINPFTITVSMAAINMVTSFASMALVDRLGRRNMLFIGSAIQCSALLTMGSLGTVKDQSLQIKSGIVAMMVIFVTGYTIGWASIVHTISAELPSSRLRDITYRSASIFNIVTQFAVTFSLPYLLNEPYAGLKSKVGFIFGGLAVVSIAFAFFCVPDCTGRTLEEIDTLFHSGVSVRHFRSVKLDYSTNGETVLKGKGEDATVVKIEEAR